MRSGCTEVSFLNPASRGVIYHVSAIEMQRPLTASARGLSLSDLRAAEWVRAYDAAWLNKDWRRLRGLMTRDVQFRIHRPRQIIAGPAAVVCYLSNLMGRTRTTGYSATDLRGSVRSDGTVLIKYRWYWEWLLGRWPHACAGSARLYLTRGTHGWLLLARCVRTEPTCER